METQRIILLVEEYRIKAKLHKTTLCSKVDISTTYYNELLNGSKNPSYSILKALLNYFDLDFAITVRLNGE